MFWERVTRTINTILLSLSIMLNLLFLGIIFYIYADLQSRIVFDIDKIRRQYVSDARFYYQKGCMNGVDYPQELKEKFNQNEFGASPTIWCSDQVKENDIEGEAIDSLKSLGKEFTYRITY